MSLLHQEQDGDIQRSQMRALMWMALFFFGWMYFFNPSTQQNTPPDDTETVSTQQETNSEAIPVTEVEIEGLPPVAEETSEADEFTLTNKDLQLVFTSVGARLKQASVVLGKNGDETQSLVPIPEEQVPLTEQVYPLSLRFDEDYLGDSLNTRRWEMIPSEDGTGVTFSIDIGTARISKIYSFDPDMDYVLDLKVVYTNLESKSKILGLLNKAPAYSIYWTPNVTSGDKSRYVRQEIIWRKDGVSEHEAITGWKNNGKVHACKDSIEPDWGAIKSAYFLVAIKPEFGENVSGWKGWGNGNVDEFEFGLDVPRFEALPNEPVEHDFRLYVGPRRITSVSQAWNDLDAIQEIFDFWGFSPAASALNWFAAAMLRMMVWFHDHIIANYGFAIIFVTLVVRGGMFPLTLKSMRSMKKMQQLAPEIQKLREEFADNPQEAQKRTMELYRERGVNPLGGCFPLMLQMPIFIAFYRMLSNAFELRRAPFIFWINDLSEPDRLIDFSFSIPMPFSSSGIDALNVLPILMGVAMVVSQKLMPTSGPTQNPQQKIIMNMMPILFAFICYSMPAGLNLYILTSTVLGIVQNRFIHVDKDDVKKKRKLPAKRPKNAYNAAQMRKREMRKEARREKQSKRRNAKDKTTPPDKKE